MQVAVAQSSLVHSPDAVCDGHERSLSSRLLVLKNLSESGRLDPSEYQNEVAIGSLGLADDFGHPQVASGKSSILTGLALSGMKTESRFDLLAAGLPVASAAKMFDQESRFFVVEPDSSAMRAFSQKLRLRFGIERLRVPVLDCALHG